MKQLIELLDRYEEIRGQMRTIGCIETLDISIHFGLDKLVEIIKDHDLEFTIGKFREEYPHIVEGVVGKYTLFAIATEMEYDEYFDEEGNLK